MIVSIDAIFGLPRKKSAGESVQAPLHGDLFFHDQAVVDEYVESLSKHKLTSHQVYASYDFTKSIGSNPVYLGMQ